MKILNNNRLFKGQRIRPKPTNSRHVNRVPVLIRVVNMVTKGIRSRQEHMPRFTSSKYTSGRNEGHRGPRRDGSLPDTKQIGYSAPRTQSQPPSNGRRRRRNRNRRTRPVSSRQCTRINTNINSQCSHTTLFLGPGARSTNAQHLSVVTTGDIKVRQLNLTNSTVSVHTRVGNHRQFRSFLVIIHFKFNLNLLANLVSSLTTHNVST